MGWPKGQPRTKRNEQPADSAEAAAAADAAPDGGEQGAQAPESAPPAGVEQGNATDAVSAGGPSDAPANPMPSDMEGFITHCEALKQPGLVLVAVRHPDIREARHREGTFSGFRMEPGAPWAQWNDGSTFPELATN